MTSPAQHTKAMKPSTEETTGVDGFLWIGQSYPKFFCESEESCIREDRPHGHPCFVHEAEKYGVSRRISHTSPWVIPGRTRIFLAHWDGETEASKGRIFGYFVLGRTEVLAFEDELAPPPGKDEVRTARCWDGEVIVTHRFDRKRKRWVRTHEECPELPEPECEDEAFLYVLAEDGEWVATHACNNGGWDPTGSGSLAHIAIEDERLAPERGCGYREDPGAVYLVDSQAGAIADALADCGNFTEAVKRAATEHRPGARVPDALQGKATVRGELVLFDDPPLFEKHPQAWFRPLERIDGDDLVEQAAAGSPKVTVHGSHPHSGAMSQQEVVSVLAERMEANKTFAGRLLRELGKLAEEELQAQKMFRVPGLGTLKAENGEVRFEPYLESRDR